MGFLNPGVVNTRKRKSVPSSRSSSASSSRRSSSSCTDTTASGSKRSRTTPSTSTSAVATSTSTSTTSSRQDATTSTTTNSQPPSRSQSPSITPLPRRRKKQHPPHHLHPRRSSTPTLSRSARHTTSSKDSNSTTHHHHHLQNPTSLTPLELLPPELIQKVFLLSNNLELPLASPRLQQSLASRFLQLRIIKAAVMSAAAAGEAAKGGAGAAAAAGAGAGEGGNAGGGDNNAPAPAPAVPAAAPAPGGDPTPTPTPTTTTTTPTTTTPPPASPHPTPLTTLLSRKFFTSHLLHLYELRNPPAPLDLSTASLPTRLLKPPHTLNNHTLLLELLDRNASLHPSDLEPAQRALRSCIKARDWRFLATLVTRVGVKCDTATLAEAIRGDVPLDVEVEGEGEGGGGGAAVVVMGLRGLMDSCPVEGLGEARVWRAALGLADEDEDDSEEEMGVRKVKSVGSGRVRRGVLQYLMAKSSPPGEVLGVIMRVVE
ncbi:hypothetical protein DFH27DRAFT_606305 [Peziza echinospora]|nr:hypothetical protein DFH27DRAFT_606305 [Peziza echinospora]